MLPKILTEAEAYKKQGETSGPTPISWNNAILNG